MSADHIAIGIIRKAGGADALLDAMRTVVRSATRPSSDRAAIRQLELAHGRVLEAAERVRVRQDEASLRLLDAALVSYQRRVMMMCVNRRNGR